ncbi:MAG: PilZ domain-containing protein [Acidiferrobacterales bacterium]
MENRWSPRTASRCEVTVRPPGQRPYQARARDISLGGLFLADVRNFPVPDTVVELDFTLSSGADSAHHRIPAQIVHVSEDGAGLMFCNFDASSVSSMRNMLYGNPVRRAAR